MSLGRLLATGKSLVGGQNSTGRYHLNKQMGLPKFGSPRNPFATEAKTEAAPLRPDAQEKKPSTPKPMANPATSEKSLKRAAVLVWLVLMVRRTGGWLSKANPLSFFRKSARREKTAIPCFSAPPVQSELTLDNVHVVRNDLSDADLEALVVVPHEVNPNLATVDQHETTGSTWDRLTTRMFGANHS